MAAQHQRGADLGIAENNQFGRSQFLADAGGTGGVIDAFGALLTLIMPSFADAVVVSRASSAMASR
jgi:hypothetical protein